MTNTRSPQPAITALLQAVIEFNAARPRPTAKRIHAAINDGTGAVATDSDHVTGSGSTSTTTERLALDTVNGHPDRARADTEALIEHLRRATQEINMCRDILRRWPEAMPRHDRDERALNAGCGACGRYTTGAANDRLRTVQAPTADGMPDPVPCCDACRNSWARLLRRRAMDGDDVTRATWVEWADGRKDHDGPRPHDPEQAGSLPSLGVA